MKHILKTSKALSFCSTLLSEQLSSPRYLHILGGRRALYEYGAYGQPLKSEGNAAESNPFRYSSEYHDTELGLIYYNYRHYNPSDGRWLTRDPLGEEETLNLYRFVNNNPVFWGDALGLANQSAEQDAVEQEEKNETKAACKEICSSMLGTLVFDYINYDSNAIILREYLSDPYQKVELEKTLKTKPSNFGLTFTLGGSANTDSTNILAKDVALRFTGAATYNLVSDRVTFNTDYLNLSSAIKHIKKTYSINAQIQSTILTGSDSWLTLEGKLNYQYEQKPEIVVSVCWTTLW